MFGKHRKAITFSFDDGNIDDVRLVKLLNKYGLKATFNLCSGKLADGETWDYICKDKTVKTVHHFNFSEYQNLYDGHEVASHTVNHFHLENLTEEAVYNEINLDKIYLKSLYGYEIEGMALPFGTWNECVLEQLKRANIKYCRAGKSTYVFDLPNELPLLNPTCHFMDSKIDELVDTFINDDSDKSMLFYIWGHSYELVTENDWQKFEEVCKKLSGKSDVYYCTNIEAIKNYK